MDETDVDLGPGIRINADDDNLDGIPDRAEPVGTTVHQENDLIELKIDRIPGAGNMVLSIGFKLAVWSDFRKVSQIEANTPLVFVNDTATVWVEWVDSQHSSDSISLIQQSTMAAVDTIEFHSFRTMIMMFGGNTQKVADTDNDGSIGDPINGGPNREGIFDLATNYYATGWDVYAYNEPVDMSIPESEINNAIDRRFVDPLGEFGGGVVFMGYSQGAGAVLDIIEDMTTNDFEGDFLASMAVYVDGVHHTGPLPNNDWPDNTYFMLNIFETIDEKFHGAHIDESQTLEGTFLNNYNVTIEDGWDHALDHEAIDDSVQVKSLIYSSLDNFLYR